MSKARCIQHFFISEDIAMCIYRNIAKWIDHELGIGKVNLELEAADFIQLSQPIIAHQEK